tara:strand:- start:3019 stop:3312 length:294 start_codon:yes stop_codon:yes gene_type:complete
MILTTILFSTFVLAAVWNEPTVIIKEEKDNKIEIWIPTAEDIAYQDSMYQIILQTQNDIDTIKANIVYILERLDYPDGSWDSIRYVKGGKVDKRRNQ